MASYGDSGAYGGGSYGGGSDYANYSYNSSSSYYADMATPSPNGKSTLRRRNIAPASGEHSLSRSSSMGSQPSMVKKLDFMFPKVESEFTVQTERGGMATLATFVLILTLSLAEIVNWLAQNRTTNEHIYVDTSLGKRMRVNLNITFPALACADLHVDAMDVAGDSQLDVEDTLVKQELHLDGRPLSHQELETELNLHQKQLENKERILKEKLPPNYCGPCYGAKDTEDQCCQTCDDVLFAYKSRRWRGDHLLATAEQCIREGRDKQEPALLTRGRGCNLSGYMTVNRVNGNFHIAMGEGTDVNGRHIHKYNSDDAPNFNISHIVHELTFGPASPDGAPLNGVRKIVGAEHGMTGMIQYFIKIVPTTYKDMLPPVSKAFLPSLYEEVENHPEGVLETNRYFYTERFRPLMREYIPDVDENGSNQTVVQAGHGGAHSRHKHHQVTNAVLPSVFFVYEIYPFAVEISQNKVPFTHLLIQLLATLGGTITIVRWADSFIYARAPRGKAHL